MLDITLFLSKNISLYYFLSILIGILFGSFLNLIIYRLPKMMERDYIQEIDYFMTEHTPTQVKNINQSHAASSLPFNLCFPASFCPSCQHTLTWWQNIPLFSYLILNSKCFYCQVPIPFRYFFIEILSGVLLLFCAYHFGVSSQAFSAMLFSLTLVVLTFIDIDQQLLPDTITLPLIWLGLLLSLFGIFIDPHTAIIGACVGYLSLWTVYWAFKLITKKEGMGYGDFKLSAALGAWLGWQSLPSILFISALSGLFIALILSALKKLDLKRPISFGPFLALSGWINLIWGSKINQFYLNFL